MTILRLTFLSVLLVFSHVSFASLVLIGQPDEYEKLFFSEVKVDENLSTGATAGKDVFLSQGQQWGNNTSRDLFWKNVSSTDTFSHQFTWSLSRSNLVTTFILDDLVLTHTSNEGVWNTVGIWMNVSGFDGMFSSSSLTFSVDGLNFGVNRDNKKTFYLQNDSGMEFSTIGGTATFNWELDPNYSGTNFKPNGRVMFSVKALETQTVSEPSALALILVGGAVLLRRRQVRAKSNNHC
ncbi:PEP-CTERM sorting domain-containing protein [Alteromonas sp. P256]|uniref:PEP-CTERM sorting domain-containing protein n=1 Tax=Alteromonas sp. P256 TaxID=3117399 RepID=UPI002FE036FC